MEDGAEVPVGGGAEGDWEVEEPVEDAARMIASCTTGLA